MTTETNHIQQTEYAEMPRNKTELMTRIHHEWHALQQAIAQLNPAQMNELDPGGWSIKDNLAHLTVWETVMRLSHLQNRPTYETLQIDRQTFEQLDEDELNQVLFQRHHTRSVADVLAELERTHAQVLTDLEQLSYNELMQPRYPDDPEARPLLGWVIGNTYEHYQEHRITIQKFIEQIKS
jgi:hypothetical protein